MLRQLARRARALAPAGEGVAARLMTTKVNQVVGAPMETYDRKVTIYSPARDACQQGKAKLGTWKIHPGEQQKWENPLMGWTSTGDALAHQMNSTCVFNSKEAAIKFAEKHGWEYEVMEPQKFDARGASTIPGAGKIHTRPKSYGDNFSSARKGTPVWPHPGTHAHEQKK